SNMRLRVSDRPWSDNWTSASAPGRARGPPAWCPARGPLPAAPPWSRVRRASRRSSPRGGRRAGMVRGHTAARGTGGDAPSVLGRGARVRGRIGGEGDLRIEGQVEGDVSVSGELSVEEGASVTGDVGAAAVVVSGALRGDVTAHGAVTVRATAEVSGNVTGAEVSLDEGASFHGR